MEAHLNPVPGTGTVPGTDLRIFRDLPGEPQANMDRDGELARQVCAGAAPATLRLYGWARPAISLGRRQPLDDLPAEIGARHIVPGTDVGSLPVVRRPTGGGAVLHRVDEVTYALALPQPVPGTAYPVPLRDLPGVFHRSLREILVRDGGFSPEDLAVAGTGFKGPFTLCFSAPVCGDLLHRGGKVAGSALRVWRGGLLIQGSIQGLPVSAGVLAGALSAAVKRVFQEHELGFPSFDGCRV